MIKTLYLLSCLVAPAQPGERTDWLLTPRLSRGQELVYRGSYSEEALAGAVQTNRAYRFEIRAFVLDTTERGAEVAFLTILRPKLKDTPGNEEPPPSSVRLEVLKLDNNGRVALDAGLLVPLDAPPTIELGFFAEVPKERVQQGQTWEVSEDGRSLRTWKLTGTDRLLGLTTLKLTAVQQSDDWEKPRADQAGWRRTETLWQTPGQGITQKVERVIERREPGRQQATHRSQVSYEQASNVLYPLQLHDDLKLEISQARAFWEAAVPLLTNPAQQKAQLDALLGRINYHIEKHRPTTYREAVLRVKRRVEAGQKGEALVAVEVAPVLNRVAAVGKPAPDFVAPDFTAKESARLKKWFGKPIVLVFYNPTSDKAAELLRFSQTVAMRYAKEVTVLGLAVSDDGDAVRKQSEDLHLTYPLLCGSGLRVSYEVKSTPKLFVLDAEGIVRGVYVGWGLEVKESVLDELNRWVPKSGK